MSSNTTIVQDLQRAVTAFNNIETAINSSGLPNTPVEDYPQAIEDLKQGSGGNVQDIKNETVNITNSYGTAEITPSEGYDSMKKVHLNYNVNVQPGINVLTGAKMVELLSGDQAYNRCAQAITLANSMSTSETNIIKVADKTETTGGFSSLLCGFNSSNADIKLTSKYTYQKYDEATNSWVTATMDTPVQLTGGLENCTCKFLLFGDGDNELTLKNCGGILNGLNCASLIDVPDHVSPINLSLASVNNHEAVIDILGDSNTTIGSQYMSLLDSVGMMLNYKGSYNTATDSYTADAGGIELNAFGILPSHGGLVHIWPDIISRITISYPDSTYGNAAPGTKLNAQGQNYTFGSNDVEGDITFSFIAMTAAEFTASSLFTANFVSKNTSGHKRELKFSSAASAANGFSDFKTAMEAKGYTITVE